MKCSSTARTDRKKERKQTDLQKHSMWALNQKGSGGPQGV
jgi:uncharacterized protein YcaQ